MQAYFINYYPNDTFGARRGSVMDSGSNILSSSVSLKLVRRSATVLILSDVAWASLAIAALLSYPMWGTRVVTIASP